MRSQSGLTRSRETQRKSHRRWVVKAGWLVYKCEHVTHLRKTAVTQGDRNKAAVDASGDSTKRVAMGGARWIVDQPRSRTHHAGAARACHVLPTRQHDKVSRIMSVCLYFDERIGPHARDRKTANIPIPSAKAKELAVPKTHCGFVGRHIPFHAAVRSTWRHYATAFDLTPERDRSLFARSGGSVSQV